MAISARASLQSHYESISKLHLRQLFADDPKRGERMTAEAAGIYLDYSKNRITDKTLNLLFQLAAERGLQSRIDSMFRGRSEEHTSELQSLTNLVCRLLLEKKNKTQNLWTTA